MNLYHLMKFSKRIKCYGFNSFTLCKENNLPIKVFNMNIKGNLQKVCDGKNVGTLVNFKNIVMNEEIELILDVGKMKESISRLELVLSKIRARKSFSSNVIIS